jgi:hypothetical protein
MEGVVTSWTPGSLTLVFTADRLVGSGTYAAWTLSLAGDVGATGNTGNTGTTGNTGAAGNDGAGYGGTSSTSTALASSGSKSLVLAAGTFAYAAGARVRAAYSSTPSTQYMEGVVTSWTQGSSTLVFTADRMVGSGTYASWVIGLAGDVGATGSTGSTGTAGTNGVSVLMRGTWSSGTAYAINDVASLSGASYACTSAHTNHQPPDASYWQLMAAAGSASLTYSTATATDAPTTTSSSYAVVSGMTLSLGAGTYAIHFVGAFNTGSTQTQTMTLELALDGTARTHTVIAYDSKIILGATLHDIIVVSGTQTVDVRWKTSGGTATGGPRGLSALRIA